MEMTMYALQENFAAYVMKHPTLLQHIDTMALKQKQQLIQLMDEKDLLQRAITYFDNDAIYLENHTLYYENNLCKRMYRIRIDGNAIIIYEQETNPFFPFLKRIFRKNILYPLDSY